MRIVAVARMRRVALVGLAGLAMTAPAQGTLYGVDTFASRLYTIDMTTGATTFVMNITGVNNIGALAYDQNTDTVFATSAADHALYTINLTTGAATLVGPFNVGSVFMHALEVDTSTGKLYGHGFSSPGTLYEISRTTGQATGIGPTGRDSTGASFGYDSDNDVLYFGDYSSTSLYTVNRATGAITLVGPYGAGGQIGVGMAYDSVGDRMFAVDNIGDTLYTLNLTTGAATLVGSLGAGTNFNNVMYVVPEPGSLAVLGLGLAFIVRRRRRG